MPSLRVPIGVRFHDICEGPSATRRGWTEINGQRRHPKEMSVDASANTSAGRPRPVYLVVGATGKQGGAVINSLLDNDDDDATSASTGRTIRFLTRNEHSASSIKLQKRCCNAYKGDLLDKSSLQMALQGVDAAFLVTDPLKGVERETEQGITFIDAAKEAGVKHITFSSVCDADKATSVPHFQSKYKVGRAVARIQYLKALAQPVVHRRSLTLMILTNLYCTYYTLTD